MHPDPALLEETRVGFVCVECVAEALLCGEMSAVGSEETCDFCQTDSVCCVTIEWLAERIADRYLELVTTVEQTPEFESNSDRVFYVQNGDTPSFLISELIEAADEKIGQEIVGYLSEKHSWSVARDGEFDWFDDSSTAYAIEIPDSRNYKTSWEGFCASLKHERRFFGQATTEVLDNILGRILTGDSGLLGEAIREIGPGSDDRFIYRGRLANDDKTRNEVLAKPIAQLGAPPATIAVAGRMNPHGICVFYGSSDPKTAVAELRAPVGGRAIVGKFEILRKLRILDLRKLVDIQTNVSYFEADFLDLHDYARFIRQFHNEIRKSVIPGRELLDYLPTQVVAEYLWTREPGRVDGLIFGSAQVSGDHYNIVLFPGAFVVRGHAEESERRITRVISHGGHSGHDDDDDYDAEFRQTVWFDQDKAPVIETRVPELDDLWSDVEAIVEEPTLSLVDGSLEVISVAAIDYELKAYNLSFYAETPPEDEPPF